MEEKGEQEGVKERDYTIPYLARSLSSMSPNASHGHTTVKSGKREREREVSVIVIHVLQSLLVLVWSRLLLSLNLCLAISLAVVGGSHFGISVMC